MAAAVDKSLERNLEHIKTKLGVGVTFDVLIREICIGERDAALVFIDGFIKDRETVAVMRALMQVSRSEIGVNGLEKIIKRYLPYFEIERSDDLMRLSISCWRGRCCF